MATDQTFSTREPAKLNSIKGPLRYHWLFRDVNLTRHATRLLLMHLLTQILATQWMIWKLGLKAKLSALFTWAGPLNLSKLFNFRIVSTINSQSNGS